MSSFVHSQSFDREQAQKVNKVYFRIRLQSQAAKLPSPLLFELE